MPDADLILLCVKPADAPVVLATLRNAGLRRETLLISILAGVSTDPHRIAARHRESGGARHAQHARCRGRRHDRGVPRTLRLQGSTWSAPSAIFEGVGKCLPVDEIHFNAVTALSGSGPGYQFLIMEALADAGVRVGLPRQLALTLVAQTALGAARMVLDTGRHPASLRDDVTTPAGCTIAGLLMLEDGRIRSVLARAVEEATKIAAHLGASTRRSPRMRRPSRTTLRPLREPSRCLTPIPAARRTNSSRSRTAGARTTIVPWTSWWSAPPASGCTTSTAHAISTA